MNNLGEICHLSGRFREAETLYRQVIVILGKALGTEHSDLAITLSNLASVCLRTQRYAEAEPLFRRALAIKERTLGKRHPDVATLLTTSESCTTTKESTLRRSPYFCGHWTSGRKRWVRSTQPWQMPSIIWRKSTSNNIDTAKQIVLQQGHSDHGEKARTGSPRYLAQTLARYAFSFRKPNGNRKPPVMRTRAQTILRKNAIRANQTVDLRSSINKGSRVAESTGNRPTVKSSGGRLNLNALWITPQNLLQRQTWRTAHIVMLDEMCDCRTTSTFGRYLLRRLILDSKRIVFAEWTKPTA